MSRANVAKFWRTIPAVLARLPSHEYNSMARYTAEAFKKERDHAVRTALKNKVPIYEIVKDYDLTEAEVGEIIKDMGGPSRRDDIKETPDEPRKGGGLILGR